jgi:hypothetical protein
VLQSLGFLFDALLPVAGGIECFAGALHRSSGSFAVYKRFMVAEKASRWLFGSAIRSNMAYFII